MMNAHGFKLSKDNCPLFRNFCITKLHVLIDTVAAARKTAEKLPTTGTAAGLLPLTGCHGVESDGKVMWCWKSGYQEMRRLYHTVWFSNRCIVILEASSVARFFVIPHLLANPTKYKQWDPPVLQWTYHHLRVAHHGTPNKKSTKVDSYSIPLPP